MRRLDREERNLRAAVDWSLAHGDTETGLRIIGSDVALVPAAGPAPRGPCDCSRGSSPRRAATRGCGSSALAAEGSLAYWMDDFAAARTAYEERLDARRRRRATPS